MNEDLLMGEQGSMLLVGEAGIGKSHLLCDIAVRRLEDDLPTLFLLGQHYSGGNPFNFICEKLGLSNKSYRSVLGALDALGESKKTKTLIMIDAINEGECKYSWYDYIVDVLEEIKEFPNISIVLSCRSTYEPYLIPEEILGLKLIKVEHRGFKGYEHRAALNYLAKQGISKPEVPVLMPEFSNPLFLKTCCKAIKNNGRKQFPKKIDGFSSLYEFYLNSVNDIVRRKKNYITRRSLVLEAVTKFATELYPDNLGGLDAEIARNLINVFDLTPNMPESLFDVLIAEGVFSLDIASDGRYEDNGREIVRFSFERFSDYAIAEYLIEDCKSEDHLAELFRKSNTIGKLLHHNRWFQYAGIIEALGTIVPERFSKEFIEFLNFQNDRKRRYMYHRIFELTFKNTILWRSGKSLSDKSLDFLNSLSNSERFDILLTLSANPNHPWNADFLNRYLIKLKMPERDFVWSTYVATNDFSENEDGEESIIRTLIEWSINAKLELVDAKILRLTAISLTWMTTTSNRRVRDQATKSLARVFFYCPDLILEVMKEFEECYDSYVIERLYAAAYGAITFLKSDSKIKKIAEYIYDIQFKDGKPYPHALIRDYARGIVEFAFLKGLLEDTISVECFQPPYLSQGPIENPSEDEVNTLVQSNYCPIKSSVMNSFGDFGNYTMACVHNWSATPLSEKNFKTGVEFMKDFAPKLPPELRTRFESYVDTNVKNQEEEIDAFDFDTFEIKIIDDLDDDYEDSCDSEENLIDEIRSALCEEDKETFRWINGLGFTKNPATFSRKQAQRWVCKRVYELGWDSNLFSDFERSFSNSGDYGRSTPSIERIGKKYQWIALHELLAHLSDNYLWIGDGFDCEFDNLKYLGPWQIEKRDIDPSLWLRKTGNNVWRNQNQKVWWQPYILHFAENNTNIEDEWLWNQEICPPFQNLLSVVNPKDKTEWIVLNGYCRGEKSNPDDSEKNLVQKGYYHIDSYIIKKTDFEKFKESIHNTDIMDSKGTDHQGFFGEYYWHTYYDSFADILSDENNIQKTIDKTHHIPIVRYEWEIGNRDNSIDESIYFNMPSKKLINDLSLHKNISDPGKWMNANDDVVFCDPSTTSIGPSYGLIRKDVFQSWLAENDLMVIWSVRGEKQLLNRNIREFYGTQGYKGLYSIYENAIEGDLWFENRKK